ncbi:MAG: amino acid ABC transporter ATP-binding protein [Propionibacteriaceae bacterium]|jgi:polar amino acid transport system ATP-binding protein|nr:amino acid ABC transporter ATP-binding protein [Propionibacteriaceae bacterium]
MSEEQITQGNAVTDTSQFFVEITNLKKSFHDLVVLDGLNLNIAKGEIVSLIGSSGSGKSTLLRCIAQLEVPEAGVIAVDNEVLGLISKNGKLYHAPKKLIRQQQTEVGMVFQNFNLFPHLTALENITEGPTQVRGLSAADAKKLALEWLDTVGLADKGDLYPTELSGGMQQRVAIARAFAMKPKLILFDEPTSALDPELVGEVLDVIEKATKSGVTSIIATHEIAFAHEISTHIAFLSDGVITEYGTPEDVIDNPKQERTCDFLRRITARK